MFLVLFCRRTGCPILIVLPCTSLLDIPNSFLRYQVIDRSDDIDVARRRSSPGDGIEDGRMGSAVQVSDQYGLPEGCRIHVQILEHLHEKNIHYLILIAFVALHSQILHNPFQIRIVLLIGRIVDLR